jgi:formamidopyrimidine-DNA glycosylase
MPELPDVAEFKRRFDRHGLHPKKPVEELDEGRFREIYRVARRVLRAGIRANINYRALPRSYLVPHRVDDGECPRCRTPLSTVKVSGRASYFCPNCQDGG